MSESRWHEVARALWLAEMRLKSTALAFANGKANMDELAQSTFEYAAAVQQFEASGAATSTRDA